MSTFLKQCLVCVTLIALSGCSTVEDIFFGAVTRTPSSEETQTKKEAERKKGPKRTVEDWVAQSGPAVAETALSDIEVPGTPNLGSNKSDIGRTLRAARDTLRAISENAENQNDTLERVRTTLDDNTAEYLGVRAAIMQRLETGTSPGNQILKSQWYVAQSALDRLRADANALNAVGANWLAGVDEANGLAASLPVPSREMSERDRRELGEARDAITELQVILNQAIKRLASYTDRRRVYLAQEDGILVGLSAAIDAGRPYDPKNLSTADARASRQPLVVIKFVNDQVSYEKTLYTAVSAALQRRPNAEFDLVAVSPLSDSSSDLSEMTLSARKRAEAVLKSMTGFGLPPTRLRLSATMNGDVTSDEVHIFVR